MVTTIIGFRPYKGFALINFLADGKRESAIVGNFLELGGIQGILALKGLQVELTETGSGKRKDDSEYKTYRIENIG